MKLILIGHRGVGKSKLLLRMTNYFQNLNLVFLDLDQQIELVYKKSIFDLFSDVSEAKFREIEQKIFNEIDHHHQNYILSVGAGFTFESVTSAQRVLWVRRETDLLGRIFFDRPRLNSKISPLEEFAERLAGRQSSYFAMANEVYLMPEGLEEPHPTEKDIFIKDDLLAGGILTLTSWHVKNENRLFLRYGCDYFEFRDDLLDLEDPFILRLWRQMQNSKRFLSFRNKDSFQRNLNFLDDVAESDWAIELGPCPTKEISIVSNHEFLPHENLSQFLLRLERAGSSQQHLKASPEITHYSEISELLQWQEEDPSRRSILPRTKGKQSRRWLWTRLYQKGRQKINFWRDTDSTAQDQPTLFEWLSTKSKPESFAALFGNPTAYSKTTIEQSEFFSQADWPVWPIPLSVDEFKDALDFLIAKGLKAAAVTSPLKMAAYQACQSKTSVAKEFQAVNTLKILEHSGQQRIFGHNTDIAGFKVLIKEATLLIQHLDSTLPQGNIAQRTAIIWGGGGTLPALQKVLPQAVQLSVRSCQPRNPQKVIPSHVNFLIWAADPQAPLPPDLQFDLVVDLNYREDSRARELALKAKKPYLSGEPMFKAQAAAQRVYWRKLI